MIEGFQWGDYVLCGLTVVMAVTGLFRGFSGSLGFVAAAVTAFFSALFGWAWSATVTEVLWLRVVGVLISTLLVFGIVRMVVKKLVNGLLSQPSDAIFGFLIGLGLGALLLFIWARIGLYLEYSRLARELSAYVR